MKIHNSKKLISLQIGLELLPKVPPFPFREPHTELPSLHYPVSRYLKAKIQA